MIPSFILAFLSFFLLQIQAGLSIYLTPSEIIQIAVNKSLHRTPQFGYAHFLFHPKSKLQVENQRQFHAQDYKECAVGCASNMSCYSFNFGKQPIFFYQGKAQYLCELLPTDKYNSSSKYQSNNQGFDHYSIRSNCSTSPCLHNSPCIPDYDNDSYECSCPRPPFEGRDCKDVDECTTGQHNCSVNATCTNKIGSFNCTCKDGHFGNGTTCRKSPCSTSPCLHNFPCIPDYDSDTYECLCARPPFEGKDCKDVDECTTGQHDCSVNSDCTNTIGSFNCTCKDGYFGNGTTCRKVIFKESDILTDHGNASYLAALEGFMKQVPEDVMNISWILCWSGRKDGFDVTKTFHPQCDGKGPTITIARKKDYVWGGYTDVPWSLSEEYKTSSKSFIFSLYNIQGFNPMRFDIVDSSYALWHGLSYGPYFYDGFVIGNNAATSLTSYNYPYSYAIPPGCVKSAYCKFFTDISYYYTIDDVEVFYKQAV